MTNRAATDTIKGYCYQFDSAILKLLQLEEGHHEITIEGVEDIDVKNATEETAIQCKYHSKTEYNHSVMAKSIRLMLNHFSEVLNGNHKRLNYLYYGHFKSGHEKLLLPITVEFLKSNLLTYTKNGVQHKHHEELKLNDLQLADFLTVLKVDINAKSYEEQLMDIYQSIMAQDSIDCDEFEAEHFFYNNALKLISTLSREDNLLKRKKSKKDFLTEINSKQILFHKWFIQYKGKKKHLYNLRSNYFTHYNISPFERFFLIQIKSNSYSKNDLKDLIHSISMKWSDTKSKNNPDTYCPYIYVDGISPELLIELKTELTNENFKFKDGFDFNGASFNPNSIIEKASFYNQVKIKILDNLSFLDMVFNKTSKTKEAYQFYIKSPFFSTSNESVKHIQIQVEDINDIKNII